MRTPRIMKKSLKLLTKLYSKLQWLKRDGQIQTLQDQKSKLEAEVPQLREQLIKVSKQLEIERNVQKQK